MKKNSNLEITPEEYLALECEAEYKSEYFDGEIFAMSGATEKHNLVSGNIFAAIHAQIKKRPCKVYNNDMRVKVSPTGLYTYPDVVAICDKPRFDDEQKDTLLNPTVIIEVLSNSTANYDRGEKFKHYRTLDSFIEYLLIAQDECYVEHYVRQTNNQWLLSETSDLQETIELTSIHCHLALSDVYDKVEMKANLKIQKLL
ncbi:MAG: Uma2 family endonuclease [Thiomargarita sp.]|nr:Uma2 family endonuclease [Thiomargarita sp.]